MYSMTSSLRAASYRHEFGRGINNYSEVYRLPADDEEFERLGMVPAQPCATIILMPSTDSQHIMFMEAMGKYPHCMEEVLADEPGVSKTCVDLGCGSGSWYAHYAPPVMLCA